MLKFKRKNKFSHNEYVFVKRPENKDIRAKTRGKKHKMHKKCPSFLKKTLAICTEWRYHMGDEESKTIAFLPDKSGADRKIYVLHPFFVYGAFFVIGC
ncbi:MAG: hypothetical protein E7316_05555 [Clostridiales bacterium]|nr:hypothetical protein [Clostridiales bacterium]